MLVSFELPSDAAAELCAIGDLSQAAKEALVLRSYEMGKISCGTVAKALGLDSRWAAEHWLKSQHAFSRMNHGEVDEEAELLRGVPEQLR